MPGSRLIKNSNYQGVLSLSAYSFCNFLLGFEGDEASMPQILAEVCRWSQLQPALRVFLMSGDEPRNLDEALRSEGFSELHRLIQMVWYPTRSLGRQEWQVCQTTSERETIANFMADQFFSHTESKFRKVVREATALGPHELMHISEDGETIGAVMVAPSQHALGIYNVCVHSERRRRGYGMSLMRSAQLRAIDVGLPLVLQCDERLSGWYRELGFQVFGEMRCFQRRN